MTTIEKQAAKNMPEHYDAETIAYYLEKLFAFPEGEWFLPTNLDGSDCYTICFELHSHHLIAKKICPINLMGNYRGDNIYYNYKKDLVYRE